MKRLTVLYILLIIVMPISGKAATFTQSFVNEYETDAIYLFIINDNVGRDVHFVADPVNFGGDATGWSTTLFDAESLYLNGPSINPFSGQFDVTFWDNRNGNGGGNRFFDFTLEWAEYLGGAAVAQGSLYYTNGVITGADGNFTSTIPNPVPASVWMLVSGLALLVGIRRHNKEV